MKTQKKVFIVGIHQSYTKTYAGGYVRVREFLKNAPSDLEYLLIDNNPTIYKDIVNQKHIITITSPSAIHFVLKKLFPIGVLAERIWSGFALYNFLKNHKDIDNALIYVPIGELLHLYLPPVLLKKQFHNVVLVVDILNFEIIRESFFGLINRFRLSSNFFIALCLATIHFFSFQITKKTITNVDYIFSVSPELVKVIREIYPKNTIDYTPSGVNADNAIIGKAKKKYRGIYVGRVTQQKGIYNLLDVWKKVVTKDSDAKLAIVGLIGSEDNDRVHTIIKDYKIEKQVTVFGTVTEKEKYQLLSESEIFIHLANYEPLFPVIGILEGFAAGLPVVVFDMPVLKTEIDRIKNSNFIYIVKNGNIDNAAKVILQLDTFGKQEKAVIAKNARQYVKRFDWKEIAKKEFKIIHYLVCKN